MQQTIIVLLSSRNIMINNARKFAIASTFHCLYNPIQLKIILFIQTLQFHRKHNKRQAINCADDTNES